MSEIVRGNQPTEALEAIAAAFNYLSQSEQGALASLAVTWANRQIAVRDSGGKEASK